MSSKVDANDIMSELIHKVGYADLDGAVIILIKDGKCDIAFNATTIKDIKRLLRNMLTDLSQKFPKD